jgi:hypothetical protein
MNSASSFPAATMRRNAEALIEPSGKASLAATFKRSAVVGVTAAGAGMLTLLIAGFAVQRFFDVAESFDHHRR